MSIDSFKRWRNTRGPSLSTALICTHTSTHEYARTRGLAAHKQTNITPAVTSMAALHCSVGSQGTAGRSGGVLRGTHAQAELEIVDEAAHERHEVLGAADVARNLHTHAGSLFICRACRVATTAEVSFPNRSRQCSAG